MTPAARLSAAIELVDGVIAGEPAEKLLQVVSQLDAGADGIKGPQDFLAPLLRQQRGDRGIGAGQLLSRNLLIYGLGGLAAPFVGIKLIDLAVSGLGLA